MEFVIAQGEGTLGWQGGARPRDPWRRLRCASASSPSRPAPYRWTRWSTPLRKPDQHQGGIQRLRAHLHAATDRRRTLCAGRSEARAGRGERACPTPLPRQRVRARSASANPLPLALITGGRGAIATQLASQLEATGFSVLAPRARRARCRGCRALSTRYFAQRVGAPLDLLVNNAGAIDDARVAKMDAASFARVLDVNLGGAFRCSQRALRPMLRARSGHIVNIGSFSALSRTDRPGELRCGEGWADRSHPEHRQGGRCSRRFAPIRCCRDSSRQG